MVSGPVTSGHHGAAFPQHCTSLTTLLTAPRANVFARPGLKATPP